MTQEQILNIRRGLGQYASEARFVGRRGKVPIDPHTGGGARANDPSTWGTLNQALDAVMRYSLDGIGIELGNGLCGIDLDHCFDDLGIVIADWATDIIKTMDSYTEVSPSGTGIHILFSGSIPEGSRKNNGVEMYAGGRYFTVTGNLYGV